MLPFRFATRTRKAAHSYTRVGGVTFIAPARAGRSGVQDRAGCWKHGSIAIQQVRTRSLSAGTGRGSQAWNLVSYLLVVGHLALIVCRSKADIVHVTGTPLAILGILHKLRHRSFFIMDINERPASVSAAGSLFSVLARFEPLILRIVGRSCDLATVVTEGHVSLLEPYGIERVTVVHNAPLRNWRGTYVVPPKDSAGRFTVAVIGTVLEGRGYELLLEALALCRNSGFHFRATICGPGRSEYLATLKEMAARLQIEEYVTWVPFVDTDSVPAIYARSHAGLALYEASDPGNDSLSNKLLEAVACGRPVIAGELPENRRFMEQHSVGWLTRLHAEDLAHVMQEASRIDLDEVARHCWDLGTHTVNWESQFQLVVDAALSRKHRRT